MTQPDAFNDDEDELRPEDVPARRHLPTCPDVRPCRERECRYHLARAVPYSCALDAADHAGGMKLEEIARHLGCTRERVRQIEAKALPRLVDRLKWSGVETSPEWKAALRKAETIGPAPVAIDGDVLLTDEEIATLPRPARLAVVTRALGFRGRRRARGERKSKARKGAR